MLRCSKIRCPTPTSRRTRSRDHMVDSLQRLQLGREDLLGDLRYARRTGDLGRLALLSYCEVRRWARMAGAKNLAEHSSELITHAPHASREQFLAHVDQLIVELETAHPGLA